MLRSLIRILCASLVQIDTEMAEKYAKQGQTTSGMQYVCIRKICRRMCVSINGSGDLDL